MKNTLTKLGLILAAGSIPAINALAGVFVITDDACPAADGDLEAHLNWESGIRTNHSRAIDSGIGLEFAYGATETLEIGASLDFGYNYASHHYARKVPNPDGSSPHADDFNFTGISLGLKNQILDPEKEENPFGLAFVGGFGWEFAGADQTAARTIGFELGLNFQKNLMDGDLILAFTPGVSFTTGYLYHDSKENSGDAGTYEDSIEYGLAGGASFQVAEGVRLGVEGTLNVSYSDKWDDTAFYIGPNFCYEAESWWITATLAPRVFSTDPDNRDHDITFAAQFGYAF